MKIVKIESQTRRDFWAVYQCEHCGYTYTSSGYDDVYFHQTVVPDMKCKECGKKAGEGYRPLATKYDEGVVI